MNMKKNLGLNQVLTGRRSHGSTRFCRVSSRGEQKTNKLIKPEKNNRKNRTMKKTRLN